MPSRITGWSGYETKAQPRLAYGRWLIGQTLKACWGMDGEEYTVLIPFLNSYLLASLLSLGKPRQ